MTTPTPPIPSPLRDAWAFIVGWFTQHEQFQPNEITPVLRGLKKLGYIDIETWRAGGITLHVVTLTALGRQAARL